MGRKKSNFSLKMEMIGVVMIVVSVLGIISFVDPNLGIVGGFVGRVLKAVFGGLGGFVIMLVLAMAGVKLVIQRTLYVMGIRSVAMVGLFVILLTALSISTPFKPTLSEGFAYAMGQKVPNGGLIGTVMAFLLIKSFGKTGSFVFLIAAFLATTLLIAQVSPAVLIKGIILIIKSKVSGWKERAEGYLFTEEVATPLLENELNPQVKINTSDNFKSTLLKGRTFKRIESPEVIGKEVAEEITGNIAKVTKDQRVVRTTNGAYQLPPISMLTEAKGMGNVTDTKEITDNIARLEETLGNFGIKAKVLEVSKGPAITRYEIQPPVGIKVSRIVGLADDVALAMAASDVRIEAPIPGKAAVGIEIPNKSIAMVTLRELLESNEFNKASSRLSVALGKDIAGAPILADLAKMPHLLIAGATGAGKSVCINTLITSILFRATPEDVKLLMIDPKMVELACYNGIPHLISPVVTNAKKAATSLRWAVREMERRYELFATKGVRDITRYNEVIPEKDPALQRLPLIVVLIDELADLMMVAPADVEDAICRLAQMARACGIHLVIATQRPSVDVITGLIKANVPSRISFAVSSQIDSRTILDMAGAEKLLGKGDMLFFPVGASKPLRVQGAYLSDKEVEEVVSYWKDTEQEPEYDQSVVDEIEEVTEKEQKGDYDELLPEAVKILIETGHASISMLQRRLHIGYARAARLIDIMEQKGIVGGYEGSKPRAILMTMEQYQNYFKVSR